MRDKIKRLFNDVSDRIERTRTEEKQLEREKEQERKYIQRIEEQPSQEDLDGAIKLFLEEVRTAKDIEENLLTAEKDEISIEKLIQSSDRQISNQILSKFDQTEQETEKLIKIFLKEIQTLNEEAQELQRIAQNSSSQNSKTKIEKGLTDLKEIDQNLQNLKSGAEEMKMSRRKFLAGSAAAATGIGLQSILDKKEPKQESPEPGRIEEILQIKELNLSCKAEAIRTSPNSGLVIFEIKNNSSDQKTIELDIDLGKWVASGTSNIHEGGPQKFQSQYEIGPEKAIFTALTIYEPSDAHHPKPGRIGFKLKGNNWKKNMSISVPGDIAKNHEVSNTQNIPAFDLNYRSTPIESKPVEKSKKAIIEAKNTSNKVLNASFSLNYPSGWHKSSLEGDFDQSASGIVVGQLREIKPKQKFEMITELHKNNTNAPKIGTMNITYFPKNHPEQAEYYIIPFNLEE